MLNTEDSHRPDAANWSEPRGLAWQKLKDRRFKADGDRVSDRGQQPKAPHFEASLKKAEAAFDGQGTKEDKSLISLISSNCGSEEERRAWKYHFEVMGSEDKPYFVCVCTNTTCSCGRAKQCPGELCKHAKFVFFCLGVPRDSSLMYQRALTQVLVLFTWRPCGSYFFLYSL